MRFFRNLLSLPGVLEAWEERKRMLSQDFQDYIDKEILPALPDQDYKLAGTDDPPPQKH